jgi:hypothetical protein
MNKKTKMWLGVGVVAAAAYYFWNKSKTTPAATAPAATTAKFIGANAIFANQSGKCPAGYSEFKNSNKVWVCDNGKGHRYKSA